MSRKKESVTAVLAVGNGLGIGLEAVVRARYRVGLDCPTPLGHNPCEVEASSDEDAKRAFFERNGICDTEWPFTIERVGSCP
jgi:hypothetical protein